jgi:WD40 repeat protein
MFVGFGPSDLYFLVANESFLHLLTVGNAIYLVLVMAFDLTGFNRFRLTADTLGEQKGKLSTTDAIEEPADTSVGFRSITVSPDGNHLAAGDSSGNLRIYDLNSLLLHSFQVQKAIIIFDGLCSNEENIAGQDYKMDRLSSKFH